MNILIFAKAPIPGLAKTRLHPLLGSVKSAKLHEKLVKTAINTCLSAKFHNIQLYISEPHPFFQRITNNKPICLQQQTTGNLAKRMAGAFGRQTASTLLIGSDCPVITPNLLNRCHTALKTHQLVVCPAEDGGFVLIGSACPQTLDFDQLFKLIDWGTESVFEQLKRNIQRLHYSTAYLDTLWDVDTPDDYHRLIKESDLTI